MTEGYVEPGGSWRPLRLVVGALAVVILLDGALPGPDIPLLIRVVAVVSVLGVVAAGAISARRVWTLRIEGGALSVGRERVPLTDVDAAHLRAVRDGEAGVDAGAAVLGGGWSVPRGRSGLPLKLTDGRTVLVPTRDPAALASALLAAVPGTPDGGPGSRGTLAP